MTAAVTAQTRLGMSVPEAAAALGISVRTAWKLIASGELPAKKAGRRTIVEPDVLRQYVASLPPAGPATRP